MEPLQYLRVSGEKKEELYLYPDADTLSFDLGSVFLLIMRTLPLLGEQPTSVKDFRNTIKNACMEIDATQQLFSYYLWPKYKEMYNEKDPLVWRLYETQLSTIYTYIELCMDKPEHYNMEDFLVMASDVVTDFSPPALITNPLTFNTAPIETIFQKTNRSELEFMFRNKAKFKPTFMYGARNPVHICLATLRELISSRFTIKKCKQCEKWFIEFTKNNPCCSQKCRKAARKEKARERLESSERKRLLKNRRQYYSDLDDRRNSKSGNDDSKELKKFNDEAKKWWINVYKGICTEDEFLNWIKSTYTDGPRPRSKKKE